MKGVNTGWLFISAAPLSRTKTSKPPWMSNRRRTASAPDNQSKTKTNLSLLLKNDLLLADLQHRRNGEGNLTAKVTGRFALVSAGRTGPAIFHFPSEKIPKTGTFQVNEVTGKSQIT